MPSLVLVASSLFFINAPGLFVCVCLLNARDVVGRLKINELVTLCSKYG